MDTGGLSELAETISKLDVAAAASGNSYTEELCDAADRALHLIRELERQLVVVVE